MVVVSSVLRTNFCAEKPAHRQSAKRYRLFFETTPKLEQIMNKLNLKSKMNLIISSLLILLNIYFIPRTVWHFNHFGGPYYTIIPMFISLMINGSLLTALLAIQKKNNQSLFLLIINLIAVVFAVFYIVMEISINLERGHNWYYNLL